MGVGHGCVHSRHHRISGGVRKDNDKPLLLGRNRLKWKLM